MAVTKVPKIKPRNSGTMTEAGFWNMIRSILRRHSMYWKPIANALLSARRTSQSSNTRLKWEYQCADCKEWHPKSNVEVDHINSAGSLNCAADLPTFVENLFCEEGNLVVLCVTCHDKKTFKTEAL